MPRPTNKKTQLEAATAEFETLQSFIESMDEKVVSIPFDFSNDPKKKEAHWGRDKNLRDVLTHLYEWHCLLLNWIRANSKGDEKPFLPAPYNWKTYGQLNIEFWEKHQTTSLIASKEMVCKSHLEVIHLIETFSDEELFTKKYFTWTGTTTLGSYCVSATSSHYNWALKKLKAHVKKCAT